MVSVAQGTMLIQKIMLTIKASMPVARPLGLANGEKQALSHDFPVHMLREKNTL